MLNAIKKLLPSNSVAGIMSSFYKKVDQLEALALKRQKEADVKEAAAAKLMSEVEAADAEAENALAQAERIRELVGLKDLPA